jgi:hypothetical protein
VRSLPEERREQACCAECGVSTEGELFLYPTERALDGREADSLCATCFSRKGEDRVVITRQASGAPTESPGERFEALFKAARVLLREKIGDEDKIIPTLKLAHKRGWRAPRVLYNAVRVVDVVDGVPILERSPATFRGSKSLLPPHALNSFNGCFFPYKRTITAEEIARAYQKALENEGVGWGRTGARITYEFTGWYLWLSVERSGFWERGPDAPWPSPSLVGKLARVALEEYSKSLIIRERGRKKELENIIPAMVAYLLRNSFPVGTELAGRKEIQRLLNCHVLCEIPWKNLPEDGYANTGEVVQLWNDVGWVKDLAERVRDPGPYEIKQASQTLFRQ